MFATGDALAQNLIIYPSKGQSAEQQQASQAQQQTAQQSQNVQAKLATFNKAYSACLEGRNYSVK